MTTPYRDRLDALVAERGALCVGLDPHPSSLTEWGLPVSADGAERLARTILDAVGDQVAVFKPQSAFFELHGSAGIAALERVLLAIADAGALSILDVKRGDIGSTMGAYAQAYLADGAPLAADAITVSPFLGFGSLQPAVELAGRTGRGLYVLARTSNPEGADVQLARPRAGADTVTAQIVAAAHEVNIAGTHHIGLVVGPQDNLGASLDDFTGSLLVPGIGAQGGRIDDLPRLFGAAAVRTLPSASREVMGAGPDHKALRARVGSLVGLHGGR